MARVILEESDSNYTNTLSDVTIKGLRGDQNVTIVDGVTDVTIDSTVENITLSGDLSNYEFSQVGAGDLQVTDKAGNIITTIKSATNSQLTFADQIVTVGSTFNSNTLTADMTIGGASITTTSSTQTVSTTPPQTSTTEQTQEEEIEEEEIEEEEIEEEEEQTQEETTNTTTIINQIVDQTCDYTASDELLENFSISKLPQPPSSGDWDFDVKLDAFLPAMVVFGDQLNNFINRFINDADKLYTYSDEHKVYVNSVKEDMYILSNEILQFRTSLNENIIKNKNISNDIENNLEFFESRKLEMVDIIINFNTIVTGFENIKDTLIEKKIAFEDDLNEANDLYNSIKELDQNLQIEAGQIFESLEQKENILDYKISNCEDFINQSKDFIENHILQSNQNLQTVLDTKSSIDQTQLLFEGIKESFAQKSGEEIYNIFKSNIDKQQMLIDINISLLARVNQLESSLITVRNEMKK
jgi:hypothetical protein